MDDIDISCPPDFEVAPVDAYLDVMPDEDGFELTAFDIGVIYTGPPEKDVPPPKPRQEIKPRAKKQLEADNSEFIEEFIQLPESVRNTVIGRLSSVMAHCIEFPEASVFMSMLGSASASVSCNYAVQYATKHPISTGLYVIVEQPPATQKSRILDAGVVPYSMAMGAHNKKVFGKQREDKERGVDAETGIRRGFIQATDATSAALDKFMSECSEGRFVIASAEQSALMSLFPETGSFSSTNELILKGYAGEYVAGMRGGRSAFSGIANGTIILIAQMGASKRVLAASGGSGMAERFFFISEPTLLGSRTFDNGYVRDDDRRQYELAVHKCVEAYSAKIFAFKNMDPGTRVTLDPCNLEQLRATAGGYQMIKQWKIDSEQRMGDLGHSGDVVLLSWLGKFETHVLKIAAVMHVFECLGNGSSVPEVIPDSMISAAMDVVETLSYHMETLLHDAGESGADAEEQAVVDVLIGKKLNTRQITQLLRQRKPFKAMGKSSHHNATRRVQKMIESGQMIVKQDGTLEVV